jgi:uncharacterized protein
MQIQIVKILSQHTRVFVSSEQKLSGQLKPFQIPCPPEKMHHALYYADLFYGESPTMASEAACLGTPAIYIDHKGRGYTDEQERKYGLVFNFKNTPTARKRSVLKAVEILNQKESHKIWHEKRERMLNDKTDLTDFLVRFVLG